MSEQRYDAGIRIEYLGDCRNCLPTLARWHHDEWHHMNPGDTVAKRTERMHQHLGKRQIPTTFVALAGDEPLGSAALVADDMHQQVDLTPWLASVFVAPAHRQQGIGSALVRRVVEEARVLQVETVYLFTPDRQDFYERMGWQVLKRTTYMNENVVIMSLAIEKP